jgi:hypothetical protein
MTYLADSWLPCRHHNPSFGNFSKRRFVGHRPAVILRRRQLVPIQFSVVATQHPELHRCISDVRKPPLLSINGCNSYLQTHKLTFGNDTVPTALPSLHSRRRGAATHVPSINTPALHNCGFSCRVHDDRGMVSRLGTGMTRHHQKRGVINDSFAACRRRCSASSGHVSACVTKGSTALGVTTPDLRRPQSQDSTPLRKSAATGSFYRHPLSDCIRRAGIRQPDRLKSSKVGGHFCTCSALCIVATHPVSVLHVAPC